MMFESLFRSLLVVSVCTGAVFLLLLLLKGPLRRRYAKGGLYMVWLVLLLRLLIPYSPSLPDAPVQLPVMETAQQTEIQPGSPNAAESPSRQPVQTAQAVAPRVSIWRVVCILWLCGAVVYASFSLAALLRFNRRVERYASVVNEPQVQTLLLQECALLGIKKPPAVLQCDIPGVPMLTGFLRPRLLLSSENISDEKLVFVLRHELCHLKRRDLCAKLILLCVGILHWFNPLVWLAVREATWEMELACDNMALAQLNTSQRAHYGEALLAAMQHNTPVAAFSTAMGGGARFTRQRLECLFSNAKQVKCHALFVVCLLAAVALGGCVSTENQPGMDSSVTSLENATQVDILKNSVAELESIVKAYEQKDPEVADIFRSVIEQYNGEIYRLEQGVASGQTDLNTLVLEKELAISELRSIARFSDPEVQDIFAEIIKMYEQDIKELKNL